MDKFPIDSYSRLLPLMNSFLRYTDKEDRESYYERALLISDYYSNKFTRLKRNDPNYNYIGDICDMWSSISVKLGKMVRTNESHRLIDYLPLNKFTDKCFPIPNQQSKNHYIENFKKQKVRIIYFIFIFQFLALGMLKIAS